MRTLYFFDKKKIQDFGPIFYQDIHSDEVS